MHCDQNSIVMEEESIKIKGKHRIHLQGLPFKPSSDQIFFYDPHPDSYLSFEIENNLEQIKYSLKEKHFEFYCFSDLAQHLTNEMVRYRFPNWHGQPLKEVGNDLLRHFLVEEDRDIGASFIRLYSEYDDIYSCYQLYDLDTYSLADQLEYYKSKLKKEEQIMFSIASSKDDTELMSVYERRFNFADINFEKESSRINDAIAMVVKQLHQQNVNEFVLRCLVPVEEKLSRVVVTPDYNILLPDYDSDPIPLTPLPKAVFLLFLRHDEGIYFKELMDYREELQSIYSKITNRTSANVVDSSLDAVTDPTKNSINEKCSRIREAFVGRMDERIAQHYFITGKRGEVKRITLPRDLVEWQCEL